jgi:restriction endonuclease S subunit
MLEKLAIPLPPLAEQKAIASTLGALADKIELNRQMNETLEAIARALFRRWFVDFKTAPLNDSEADGPNQMNEARLFSSSAVRPRIPNGWSVTNLSAVIAVFDSKRIPLSGLERQKRQGPYPYYGAASVMAYIDDYLFDGVYLLMGEDGSVISRDRSPVLQYVWGKFWVNNHAHVLRGTNGISTEHVLLHLKNCNITAFVTGAVQPKLNQRNMNQIPFIVPPPRVAKAFAETIDPLFAQIRANTDQSQTLATVRDTLLPKLLSGAVVVDASSRAQIPR